MKKFAKFSWIQDNDQCSNFSLIVKLSVHLYHQHTTLWIIIIGASATIIKAEDEIWQQKIPIKFLRAVMEQSTLCESGYADYDSCENAVSSNSVKRFILKKKKTLLQLKKMFIIHASINSLTVLRF